MIDIVITAWNAKVYLLRCLRSIEDNLKNINYQIILVDNGSTDGTSEMIKEDFPHIFLLRNSQNKGVAPARNQGIRVSRNNYLMLLDADAELTKSAVENLLEFMETHPPVGVVGPKLIDPNGALQFSCRQFPRIITPIYRRLSFLPFSKNSQVLREHQMSDWDHSYARPVDYVIGACQLIRRSALEEVGLLDEKIFYGPEDIDFCLRMWLNGWMVYYYPDAVIIHHEQRVTKRKPFNILSFRHYMSLVYFFKKYRPEERRLASKLVQNRSFTLL